MTGVQTNFSPIKIDFFLYFFTKSRNSIQFKTLTATAYKRTVPKFSKNTLSCKLYADSKIIL